MVSTRAILLLSLVASSALASPIRLVSHLQEARDEVILYPRQGQSTLSQPVTFQSVTTSQSDAGPITTTCNVTLSPVTAADGSTQVLEEKQCKIDVGTGSASSSSSSGNGGGSNTSPSSTTLSTETATQPQETTILTSSSSAPATATDVPAISQIGVGTISAPATGNASPTSSSPSATTSGSAPPAVSVIGPGQIPATDTGQPTSSTDTASATTSGSAPPAVSIIGPGQIPVTATGTAQPGSTTDTASATTPITSVTTLSNGQLSTSIITPSAAAAQEAAATTPGQKLEVLPIGLGVFAGVSVIALIVVGLVTYERTKYRKAFRQRKLAEEGANLGYGGMAERT